MNTIKTTTMTMITRIAAASVLLTALAPPAHGQADRYYITELGTLGGDESVAHDVNHDGSVVGWSRDAAGQIRGFLWQDGRMIDIGSLEPGAETRAYAINSRNEIVGISNDLPFYWRDGVMTEIPNYSTGWPDAAVDINDESRVVWTGSGVEGGYVHSFYWYPGMSESVQLVEPAEFANADVRALNNFNVMTGAGFSYSHPHVAWRSNVSSWIMLPRGLGGDAVGNGINDLGWVCGVLVDGAGHEFAYWWDGATQWVLSNLPGHDYATAFDINNAGLKVGCAEEHWLYGPRRAFVADRSIIDLNTRRVGPSDLVLRKAYSISNTGLIAGYGTTDNGAARAAFLATPIPDDGLLLMPDATTEEVHVLDPDRGTPLGTFPVSFTETPMEIIDGNDGDLLISDRYRNTIYRLSPNGSLRGTFFAAAFYEFRGIERAPNGDIIAASTGGVRRFTRAGNEIWQPIGDEIRDVAFTDVMGVDGYLATHVDNATVQSLDLDLSVKDETNPGDVIFPEQVTTLLHKIIAASFKTQSVVIFDANTGNALIEIRTQGQPRGVIALDNNTLLISTTTGLYHYTQSGTYLRTIMTGKGFWYLSRCGNFGR